MIALLRKTPIWFWCDILFPFVVTRLALTLIAWIAFHVLPLPNAFPFSREINRAGDVQPTLEGVPKAHPFVNMWARWDAGWYLGIAKEGYQYEPGKPSSSAFFPLYPLAVRLLHAVLFLPLSDYYYLVAAIVLSNLCLLAGLSWLHLLLSFDYNAQVVRRTILVLLLFPTSYFFSAAYSESLFLALTVGSFYFARRQCWIKAAALAGLAALCRSQGIILIVPLLIEYLAQKKWRWRTISWDLVSLLLIPAAIAIFAIYLKLSFGSWDVLFKAQQPWGRRFLASWWTLPWVVEHASVVAGVKNDWIDLAFFAALLAVATLSTGRLRLSYTAYIWTAVMFFSSWGMLGSVPRFVLVVFPLFVCLALFCERNRAFRLVCLLVSSALSVVFFIMYSQWQWIA